VKVIKELAEVKIGIERKSDEVLTLEHQLQGKGKVSSVSSQGAVSLATAYTLQTLNPAPSTHYPAHTCTDALLTPQCQPLNACVCFSQEVSTLKLQLAKAQGEQVHPLPQTRQT